MKNPDMEQSVTSPKESFLRRSATPLALTAGAVLILSACTPTLTISTVPLDPNPEVEIVAFPNSIAPVDPDTAIQLDANGGLLTNVTVTGPDGPVSGVLSEDGSQWTATGGPLKYSAAYSIQATGSDSRGRTHTLNTSFSTIEPEKFFTARVSPSSGQDIGVGLPIVVTFNKKVTNKAEVEQALTVRTSTPILGAWSWSNNREIEFRPKDLWPGGTQVEVDVNLTGVEANPGVFGKRNTTTSFQFRSAVVSVVDAQTHTMDVYRDGELLRSIPVTTGKPGFETRSGTKVLLSKERSRIMDAATGGTSTSDPDYYRVNAEYAMRLNYTGEYVHAAPWSTGSQGSDNVSHGCVGMSTDNARWWWNENNVGDVVIVKNTSRGQTNDGNGITVWNEPWTEWLTRSATGAQFTKPLQSSAPDLGAAISTVGVN
jgi:lipoprotein-anchoring transpeptidase ErfK/SrfK